MRKTLAIVAVGLLAACEVDQGAVDTAFEDEVTPLRMVSIVGIGDVTVTEGYLVLNDGSEIPIQQLGEGVYALPSRPSRLANGEDFCFDQPVSYFTLHEHDEGLIVMNIGDWIEVPELPASDTWEVPGGCALFTYERA